MIYTKPKLVLGLFILEKLTYILSFVKRGLVENPKTTLELVETINNAMKYYSKEEKKQMLSRLK